MKKEKTVVVQSEEETKTLTEIQSHYTMWTDDMKIRLTRKNGWNAVTDAFWGKLPDDWPYISKVTDPRIRTTIIEKNARLLNSKLRGRLVPREGADAISASINNALLDYQWDSANNGGSMLTKLAIAEQDTRLYGSKFALVLWKEVKDRDGEIKFCGNEMKPLDIRDCGIDFGASHIRDAKWFQHREWKYVEDLERENDNGDKDLMWKNLNIVKGNLTDKRFVKSQSKRMNEWTSRIKELKGLEDRLGRDMAFPVVELVTEYREDRWITFSPDHNVILRDIENPYEHGKIPVAQLRYYPLQDDPMGESEVEAVLPLWKAIQATVCGYMDEVILKMRPPLKIVEGAARIETIVYGPEAQWLVSNPDAVTEMRGNGEAVRYFQTTYSALVSAFNTAMGDSSQGTGGVDPFNPDKTATEVRAIAKQQNTRDQKNQTDLSEFLKDIMMMWLSNNKQFLFMDPNKKEFVLKIVGKDNYALLQEAGLDATELDPDATQEIQDIISTQGGNLSDDDLKQLVEAGQTPKYGVADGDGMKPKMEVSDHGDVAKVYVTPEDLQGTFDYIPDVKSMASGASEELSLARQRAIASFTSPVILQSLAAEGYRPKFKEIFSADLESSGLSGAERFFEKIPQGGMNGQPIPGQQQGAIERGVNASAGSPQTQQLGGLPEISQAQIGASTPQQMAGSVPLS